MNQIGRYQIIQELGRGAMGVVFEARDPLIGRTVALKMIRLDSLGTPDEREWLQERLFREARSAGALSHPGIVIIYDLGTSDDLAYIAMEYVEGPTLEQTLATRVPLHWSEALSIVKQTAAALDHAHAAGVVHRDVKPANIMLQRGRTVKITDFGIAKITSTQQLTRTGMTMGTPSYMSPEQITAQALDGRADQFSLAVVAYQILTGVKPFQGDSLANLVHQIVYEKRPSARSVNQTLREAVDEVLHRGLAKLAQDRYPTCAEFAEGLEAALAESPKTAVFGSELAGTREKQESEFTALFGEYIEARQKQERAAKLRRDVAEVERLLTSGDWRAASAAVEEARGEFADETALLTLSDQVEEFRREAERQSQIDDAVQRARGRLSAKDFEAALSILDAAAEYGGALPIAELRAQVLEEKAADARKRERQEYAKGLEKTLQHAKELMIRKAPGEAVTFLESATGLYGKESEFTRLFAGAIEAKKLAELRAARINACVTDIAESLSRGDWHAAQKTLEGAQRDCPGEPALAPLVLRIDEARRAGLRDQPTPADSSASVSPAREQPKEDHAPGAAAVSLFVPSWAEPRTPNPSPAVIKKRATIPMGLLVGASAAAAVILSLLLLKAFVWSVPDSEVQQGKPAKLSPRAAPPSVKTFAASPDSIRAGQTMTLHWNVEDATEVVIDQEIGKVAASGSLILSPIARTHYLLTATGPGGKVFESAFVNVRAQQSPPAVAVKAPPSAAQPRSEAPAVALAPKIGPGPSKPREGTIVWSGNLAPGSILNIVGGTADQGTVTGSLPGVPVSVAIHPDSSNLTVALDSGNEWKRLTIHNSYDGKAQSIIVIKWTALQ